MSRPFSLAGASVLVTGGCGFIGAHVVRRLLDRDAARVVALDSLRYGTAERLAGLDGRLRLVKHDLGADDPADLASLLRGIDAVVHLAAEKHNQSRDRPFAVVAANVSGTLALCEAAAAAGVRRLVFSSSLYAYGRWHAPLMVETETPEPRTVYGISKLAGEHIVARLAGTQASPATLRFFFVYGPGQEGSLGYRSVIVKNFERLARGEPPTVYGDGRQELDYVYIDDVVDATLLALEAAPAGALYNVGSSVPTPIEALVDGLIAASGRQAAKEYLPPDETAGTSRAADIGRIRRELGWAPRVPLDEGLRRTWRWMQP